MNARIFISVLALPALSLLGLLGGCMHEEPNYIYMPDMAYSPAFKAQKAGSMHVPAAGTVPVEHERYLYEGDPEAAGRELKNPLRPTPEVLQRGQAVFNTFCIVCHGPTGYGNGSIVPKFPKPLSLHSERAKNYSDGRIFHIITVGQNMMPRYSTQVPVDDRWAVIHYLRVLQGNGDPSAPQQPAGGGP